MLVEAQQPRLGMCECPESAGPLLNILLVPGLRKERTFTPQRVDQHSRITEVMAIVRTKLRENASRAFLPFRDEAAGSPVQEHEA